MIRNWWEAVCSFSLLVVVCGTSSAATVYDLSTDYSTTINTSTSTWSYRTGTVRDGNYPLLDLNPASAPSFGIPWTPGNSPSPNLGWQSSTSNNVVPFVGKNQTGGTETFVQAPPYAFVWPADQVMVHPNTNGLVVISWLSPGNGTIDIDYQLEDAHTGVGGASGVNFYVDRNAGIGLDALDSDLLVADGNTGPLSLTGISVMAGDRINIVVGLQQDLNANATFLDATISFEAAIPAPEPSSLWLAGLGMLVVARRIRQRTVC